MVIGIILRFENACNRRTALRLDPVVGTVTLADSSLLTADFHSPNSFPARCVEIVNLIRGNQIVTHLVDHLEFWRCQIFERVGVVLLAECACLKLCVMIRKG